MRFGLLEQKVFSFSFSFWLIFCPLDPNSWILIFLRIRIQEAKIFRIQRIRNPDPKHCLELNFKCLYSIVVKVYSLYSSRMTLVSLLPLAHPAQCGNLYLANLGVPCNVFKAGVNIKKKHNRIFLFSVFYQTWYVRAFKWQCAYQMK